MAEDQDMQDLPPAPGALATGYQPTSGGQMYITPTQRPPLPPDAQQAMQAGLADATAAPPPGMPTGAPSVPQDGSGPDLGTIYRQAFSHLPVDQAAKAVEAAVRYQGQRGYQQDLASGMPAAQAMAKWGPMLFHSSPSAQVQAARLAQQPATGPVQAAPILDQNGQPIPGQFAYRSGNRVERIQSGLTEAQRLAHEDRQAALAQRAKEKRDQLSTAQKLYALRQEEKELNADPLVNAEISAKASPERRKAIQAKKDRLAAVQQRIEDMIAGVEPSSMPAPAGTAPRPTKRFKDKSGKHWIYTGTGDPNNDRDPKNWQEAGQ